MASPANPLLDKAKSTLQGAKNLENSLGSMNPAKGEYKDKPAPKSAPKPASALGSGLAQEAASAGQGIKSRMDMSAKAIGKFHDGGTVPKTGTYKLLKGEKVVAKDEANMDNETMKKATAGLAGKGSKPASKARLTMKIRPTDNGKYIANHEYAGGGMAEMGKPSEEHGIEDIKALHKHIDEHYGSANGSGVASDWEKAQAGDKEAQPKGEKKPAAGVAPANTKD